MQEEKQKRHSFYHKLRISGVMKTRLLFWIIYAIVIVAIYCISISAPKKVDVGIKQSTVYLIKQFEGLRNSAYDDGHGNMTIGIGHLIKPSEEKLYYTTMSNKQAHALLERDMRPCERVLKDRVGVNINQHQFDALMSFCHNIGPDNFANSEVIRQLNNNQARKAANAMLNWNKPETVIKRRRQERALFLSQI